MSQPIPFGKPILGQEEKDAVWEVMESGILAHGKKIEAFEASFAAFTGAAHAVGVSSCTAAMHMVYFHMGLGLDDEVIVPAQTHTATAHAVELTGAKPVFVDAVLENGNLDIDAIEAHINPKTKAIAVVHFLGTPVDMNAIKAIATPKGLTIVEDCALAIGTTVHGRHAGLQGNLGAFSFYPVKHMTTAEGGMLITDDEALARSIRNIRAFGMDKHVGQRKVPGMYDVQGLGFNYRLNEMQAAIGCEQMKRLDAFLEARHKNHGELTEALAKIDGLHLLSDKVSFGQSSHYCHSVLLPPQLQEHRPAILTRLKDLGIGTSVYYPHPVPLMSYYREKYGYREGQFPNAEAISRRSIALPVGPHLQEGDPQRIADALLLVMREFS